MVTNKNVNYILGPSCPFPPPVRDGVTMPFVLTVGLLYRYDCILCLYYRMGEGHAVLTLEGDGIVAKYAPTLSTYRPQAYIL